MRTPSYRTACLVTGGLYLIIGLGILGQGAANAMAQYGVPESTRALPHYADAIKWVYVHAAVLGAIVLVVGWWGREPALQRAFARVLLAAQTVYLALDLRSADWALGTGLYEGRQSLGPAMVGAVVWLLFVGPALRRAPVSPAGSGPGEATGPPS